jgi:DNA modification methylase|tara:strand:- start:42 stop:1070 length:1029 start_codon:yes stop_codon:yes gene_type:complete
MIVNEDCIKHLKTIEDNYFDSVVTDPPYELGFMGKIWDSTGIAFTTELWKEVYRTLKPGGYLLSFSASRNYHRMAVAIEDSGFEIRDQIMWIYGSGFPKNMNIGKALDKKLGNKRKVTGTTNQQDIRSGNYVQGPQDRIDVPVTVGDSEWEGWGTALKPAHEPICMARKQISEKSIVDNVLKHGTGGINIDGCRIEGDDTGGERKITSRKSRNENGVWTDENSGMDNEQNSFADADPRGRFPANLIHDGLEEDWSRFFYCPKANKKEKGDSNHPTVKPVELMRYLVRLVTPKDGIVLDPFAGTGTTGEACILENRNYYLIEAEESYIKDIENRTNRYSRLGI